jgi:hypothetical protein
MDLDRRRVVMILIILAIAVPLLVEGYTLAKLVGSHLAGDDTPTETPTVVTATSTDKAGVGAGDELLAETDRPETVTTASLSAGEESWTLTITVTAENTGNVPYELRLGDVTTDEGDTVSGSATTGSIPSGQQATATAQWQLPSGQHPATLAVTALEYRDGGSVILVDREVQLASLSVDG